MRRLGAFFFFSHAGGQRDGGVCGGGRKPRTQPRNVHAARHGRCGRTYPWRCWGHASCRALAGAPYLSVLGGEPALIASHRVPDAAGAHVRARSEGPWGGGAARALAVLVKCGVAPGYARGEGKEGGGGGG